MGTVRDLGFELALKIEYGNTRPVTGQLSTVQYRYRPQIRHRPKLHRQVVWTNFPVKRTVIERRGVHITPQQVGLLGAFNFESLVIAITTSLTFLVVANTVSKWMAEYALANSKYYRRLINEYSPDFSDLRDRGLERNTLAQLQRECAVNHLDVSGDKYELILKLNSHYEKSTEAREKEVSTQQSYA